LVALELTKRLACRLDELLAVDVVPARGGLNQGDAAVLIDRADHLVGHARCKELLDQQHIQRCVQLPGDDIG
jgi:hypothetical protein